MKCRAANGSLTADAPHQPLVPAQSSTTGTKNRRTCLPPPRPLGELADREAARHCRRYPRRRHLDGHYTFAIELANGLVIQVHDRHSVATINGMHSAGGRDRRSVKERHLRADQWNPRRECQRWASSVGSSSPAAWTGPRKRSGRRKE
jgi:hypothetical protein